MSTYFIDRVKQAEEFGLVVEIFEELSLRANSWEQRKFDELSENSACELSLFGHWEGENIIEIILKKREEVVSDLRDLSLGRGQTEQFCNRLE